MNVEIEGNGIIYKKAREMETYHYTINKIEDKEILLKMEYSSVCGSDLHTYLGHRSFNGPTMIGHEGVGRILALGDRINLDSFGNKIETGDLILFQPYIWCNHCEYCASSKFTFCLNRTSVGSFSHIDGNLPRGTFSQHLVLPEGSQFIKIKDNEISLYALSPVNCALATVMRAFEDFSGNVLGKRVLILGAGALGIYASSIADSMGAKEIYVMDKNIERLKLSEKYGATGTFTSIEELANDSKTKNIDGIADIALNLSGYPPLALDAIKLMKRTGRFIEIGTIFSAEINGLDLANLVVRGVNVTGFRTYEIRHLRDAYDFIVSNKYNYDFVTLVKVNHSLTDINNAFEDALKGEQVRQGIRNVLGDGKN